MMVSTAALRNSASVAFRVSQVSGVWEAGAAAGATACASARVTATGVITVATAVPAAPAPFRNWRRGIWSRGFVSSAMTPLPRVCRVQLRAGARFFLLSELRPIRDWGNTPPTLVSIASAVDRGDAQKVLGLEARAADQRPVHIGNAHQLFGIRRLD